MELKKDRQRSQPNKWDDDSKAADGVTVMERSLS